MACPVELLHLGTKDAWLCMQRKSTISFMVQWSQGFIFFETQVKTIGGDSGKGWEESNRFSSPSDQKWCPIKWQWNSHCFLSHKPVCSQELLPSLWVLVWASQLMLTALLCSSITHKDKNRCAPKHPSPQGISDLHPCLCKVSIPFTFLFPRQLYSFWLTIRPCFNNLWASVVPAKQGGGLCMSETFSSGQRMKGHGPTGVIYGPWVAGLLPSSSFPAYLCAHVILGHPPLLPHIVLLLLFYSEVEMNDGNCLL